MTRTLVAGIMAAVLGGLVPVAAQDGPPMPKPQKEHEWLHQLVGEWDAEGECVMDPSQSPVKFKGTESGRKIGGFWVLLENKGEVMGAPFTGILSLGYDPGKKKYVGTWFDSMTSYLWQYAGSVDPSGKILTLETEGPCPQQPGKLSKFKEVLEIKGRDHKLFTSSIEKDGKWTTMMTVHYRRR